MTRRPLSARVLGLKHLPWAPWQRALLLDGPLVIAVLLVLADLASAWVLVVLPLAVAVVVKANDVLAGRLHASRHPPTGTRSADQPAGAALPGPADAREDSIAQPAVPTQPPGLDQPTGPEQPGSPGPDPEAPAGPPAR